MTRRPRRPAALALATALLASSALVAGCDAISGDDPPQDATTYREPFRAQAGALLSRPVPDGDETDYVALRALLDNIAHTPPGATIRIVGYSLSLYPVAEALLAADARGVSVQVVLDYKANRDSEADELLEEGLGDDASADSFIVQTDGSARRGSRGRMHQKTWMFSRTGQSRHVVMVGSMNLSYYSTGQYNDTYAFVDRRDVWRAFGRVFDQQRRDRPVRDPAVTARLDDVRAWFFPGFTLDDDPLQRLLDDLPARPGTRLRMVAYAWSGERGLRLADRVAALRRAGADVEVVSGDVLTPRVSDVLRGADVPVYLAKFDDGSDTHNKLALAEWDGDGGQQRMIVTGSLNLGDGPLERDEVLVAVDADRGPAERDYRRYVRLVEEITARVEREAGER
ncbi:hypothetical protein GCM10023340_33570 [Nocardioides marinquilinus]|uniref:Phospholipase D-like domain-containing protein n=1 Tax=Nocardioides marinquilinus TaxID=1210400 RepID=A0ABP9PVD7_9ACTN